MNGTGHLGGEADGVAARVRAGEANGAPAYGVLCGSLGGGARGDGHGAVSPGDGVGGRDGIWCLVAEFWLFVHHDDEDVGAFAVRRVGAVLLKRRDAWHRSRTGLVLAEGPKAAPAVATAKKPSRIR